MKILQLCKKFPFPLKDGESIAVHTLSRALQAQGCKVSLLAMNTTKHYFQFNEPARAALRHYESVDTVPVDNRIKMKDALLNLFSKDSYHVSRFLSQEFRQRLIKLLQEQSFDLVQLETLYLTPYISDIRKHSDAVIALRSHNVEHEIWERISRNARFYPKKWYLQHLTHKLKRYEIERLQQLDMLVAISGRDLRSFQRLGYGGAHTVAPIGIEANRYDPDGSCYERPLSVSFIGSLDWMPNIEGLQWFLNKIWYRFQGRYPEMALHIAGRHTPEWLQRISAYNIHVHGEVPDAKTFINDHGLMVVPLRSGSGMRAKILEGMALGKAVLTTSLGLEGIDATPGKEVLVADSPEAFRKQLAYAWNHPREMARIGCQARAYVMRAFDSGDIARRLLDQYASLTVEAL